MEEQYYAAYERVQDVDKDESKRLGSNEAVIGQEVKLVFGTDDEGIPTLNAASHRDLSLGRFSTAFAQQISSHRDAGMTCKIYLSAVIYRESDGMFSGEFCVICFAPANEQAWEHFCMNVRARIANGAHPDIRLAPKTQNRVIESDGQWCLMKKMEHAKLDRGAVYFKKKRSWSDALVELALKGGLGCKVAAVVFWIVVIALIVFLVWKFVL